jgi:hypothetical protein
VRIVVEEVQKALQPKAPLPSPNVTGGDIFCLFYDAPTGLETVGRQLEHLQEQGVTLGCFQSGIRLPETFQPIQWSDHLARLGASEAGRVLKNYSLYLVANLSRQGLAELATGVTASPQSQLVYSALGQKSRVTAVQDPLMAARVSCPHDPIKLAPVQADITDHLNRVKDLGVDPIPSEALLDHLSHQVGHESQAVDALHGFVTLEDVEGYEGRQIRVIRDTKITPLAEDWLRDHRIELRWIDP